MSNPFLRRATEYIRDDSAFLAIVSPEPLTAFVAKHKKRPLLFQQTVRVIGTPGSGKTMMASLVEFRLVESVLRDQNNENNRLLARAFAASGFAADEVPTVAAVRIPMESEYRDFWELPYEAAVKTKLILSLIQARTVLALVRNLTANGRRTAHSIRFIARDDAGAQLEQIGGTEAEQVLARARAVERAVYSIGASLVPLPSRTFRQRRGIPISRSRRSWTLRSTGTGSHCACAPWSFSTTCIRCIRTSSRRSSARSPVARSVLRDG